MKYNGPKIEKHFHRIRENQLYGCYHLLIAHSQFIYVTSETAKYLTICPYGFVANIRFNKLN